MHVLKYGRDYSHDRRSGEWKKIGDHETGRVMSCIFSFFKFDYYNNKNNNL